ncbi:uncharacterized protein LOC133701914 [Populus nigra]|uniref:uncharacterized protein LOC133701914 n=1 Tax=Populus nigra TaxID=3691 RepID=UPI002B266A40|nr:uncharacterized protein LOC133701914 [Populus nigra]
MHLHPLGSSKPYPRPSVSSNTLRADAASPGSHHPLTKMMWINHHYCATIMVVVSLTWEIKGQPNCAQKQAKRMEYGCCAGRNSWLTIALLTRTRSSRVVIFTELQTRTQSKQQMFLI